MNLISKIIHRVLYFFFFDSEENVYLLCKKLCEDGIAKTDGSDLFVVFISNEKNQASNLVYQFIFHWFVSALLKCWAEKL